MKKGFLVIILLLVIAFLVFKVLDVIEYTRVSAIKKGWNVEIINEYINVREKDDSHSKAIGKVKKGQTYKVLEMVTDKFNYYWYKIEVNKSTIGWIANDKIAMSYLKDRNNPVDFAYPKIKFTDNEYHVSDINNIKYDHLQILDDRDDYTITHIVYHEVKPYEGIDQYWIQYTVTDGSNNSTKKIQNITFDKNPKENEVKDFSIFSK